ncbi:MAG: hypothetical protein JKX99_10065 [Robiginitomaculum sp.]|nr:hypothetical protein [Robiginitomaculum sp.]
MKIALYKNTRFNFIAVSDGENAYSGNNEYLRISEYADVEFTMLPKVTQDEITAAKIVEAEISLLHAQNNLIKLKATA